VRERLTRLFKAFTYRDFSLLWAGAFTSSCGTWMQTVAQSWLLLTITGKAAYLAWAEVLQQAPFLALSLVGGVLADRMDRRRILLLSQVVQLTSAFLLAGLVYAHRVEVWMILVLAFVVGVATSFGGPAYQALVPTLVDKEDVPNAVALNSIQFNLARVVGPVLDHNPLMVRDQFQRVYDGQQGIGLSPQDGQLADVALALDAQCQMIHVLGG